MLVSLWVLLWIGVAIWPYHRGLWGYSWGLLTGFMALVIAAKVTAPRLKNSDAIAGIVFANIMQTFVLTALLIHCVPHFRVGVSLPDTPQNIFLESLGKERPPLPSHVTLLGQLQPELTIRDIYQPSRTKQDPNPRPIEISYTPLVSRDWTPADPVTVLVDGETHQEQRVWTGILYPFAPRAGEPGPLINPMLHIQGMGYNVAWLQRQANFQFEPEYAYLLMTDNPAQLRQRLYFVLMLFGIYLLGMVFLYVRPKKQS
ncbi:MAG: hypothetical protein O2890_04920 [Cyanobacteria bacterium]|nr:hypothetical protein [Cyanobacteriota bacterium]